MSSPWTLYALQICEESQKEHLDLYSLHHHPILLWEDLSHNSSRPLCGMYCCALRIPDETIAYPPPHTHLRVSKHLFFRVPLRNEFYPLKTKSRVWSRKMMQSCEEKWFSFPFLKKTFILFNKKWKWMTENVNSGSFHDPKTVVPNVQPEKLH